MFQRAEISRTCDMAGWCALRKEDLLQLTHSYLFSPEMCDIDLNVTVWENHLTLEREERSLHICEIELSIDGSSAVLWFEGEILSKQGDGTFSVRQCYGTIAEDGTIYIWNKSRRRRMRHLTVVS